MKKFTWLLLIATVCTSAAAQNRTLYEETIYNKPNRGVETEVYLGDRMLIQQEGAWRECITPQQTYSKTTVGWTGVYKSGEPICKRKLNDKYYWPNYINGTGHGNKTLQAVSWKGKKGKYKLCQKSMGMSAYCIKKLSEDDVEAGETFVYKENTFQQSIEYAGRSRDILKFTYSEFTGGFARQAFTRDFQVDLSEGKVAAYKGAIIEIIEATNIQIKYKVIRNFASDQQSKISTKVP